MHPSHAQGICVILFVVLLINLNSVSGLQVSWQSQLIIIERKIGVIFSLLFQKY